MSPSKAHLSAGDLERLRTKLLAEQAKLLAAARTSQEEVRGVAADPQSEEGDVAERMIEQESALRIAAFDQTLLTEVQRALAKIDAGTYGKSEESGEPIPVERLLAIPWARRTADEEERLHRR